MELQRTISEDVEVEGVNVYNGRRNKVRFHPANDNSGLTFIVKGERIPSSLTTAYNHRKSIWVKGEGHSAGLVEHLLSAVYALGIDNLDIELSDGVCPTTENCAREYFEPLKEKLINLSEPRKFLEFFGKRPIMIRSKDGDRFEVRKSKKFVLGDSVFYEHMAVRYQHHIFSVDENNYKEEIMDARSPAFLGNHFLADIFLVMGKMGLHGLNERNYLLIGGKKDLDYMNPPEFGVRYNGEEFVRHKILDAFGTLALAGRQFKRTHFHFNKTGHKFDLYALRTALLMGSFRECYE